MRDATIHYLQKSLNLVDSVVTSGKRSALFGAGGEDITFTKSGIFTELAPDTKNKGVLEYHNVTIPEGVSILGNSYRANQYDGVAYPFYLKVNGTLTVNGVLNMNGCGQCGYGSGGFHHNHNAAYNIAYTQTGLDFSPVGYNTATISEQKWDALRYSGEHQPFFNGQTYLVGAGISRAYKWIRATKKRTRDAMSCTALNTGGYPHWNRNSSGGGGGFLALYYEDLDYQGPLLDGYYAHINCNGGDRNKGDGGPQIWGGGMMVISARKIVVGPNGYICCNPCDEEHRSYNNPSFVDYDLNAGGMALMNRKTMGNWLCGYHYGSPIEYNVRSMGGPGFCVGYKIDPVFREQNR